ncbi:MULTISPECIES: glycosyltransferase family 2 protein [Sphingobacterium]|uniref:glycosyltransferase family 2 protein n=1 Tax=Sphingobacterium TaxID=28453 RepID=UPI0013DB6886|nr:MULTISPECIES: glycosyltransferase [unclassified Sphingobacterium]
MSPKVSIIIPCYNQDQFLNETLKSVADQTYRNWECLIIDDGSSDDSASIANRWGKLDKRFKVLQKVNGGLSSARNYGLTQAQGDYIQFLDGDDLLYEDKLNRSLECAGQSEIIITSFDHLKKDKHLSPFCTFQREYFNYESILLKWDKAFSIPIHCGLFKRKLLKGFQFDIDVRAGEDWLFWLAIYQQNPTTYFLDETLVCYRLHEKSITQDTSHMTTHKQICHLKIYNSLSQENRQLFFERFSSETLDLRAELTDIRRNQELKRERKLSNRIKRFFKHLFKFR